MGKPVLVDCQDCGGRGWIGYVSSMDEDMRSYTCSRCDGTGRVCSRCSQSERWCECPEGEE